MLGYKYSNDIGEILMTHGGNDLRMWLKSNTNKQDRVHLAADFLRQSIMTIKTLHSFGFSHGDLKPENICVRRTRNGHLKFTLIDFGLCRKLVEPDDTSKDSDFRGNLMFASDRQVSLKKPTRYCDLMALLLLAYYMVNEDTPATELGKKMLWMNPLLFTSSEYLKFRAENDGKFDQALCEPINPFYILCRYLVKLKNESEELAKSNNPIKNFTKINYNHLISLIPAQYGEKKNKSSTERASPQTSATVPKRSDSAVFRTCSIA